MSKDNVTLQLRVHHETEHAWLLSDTGEDKDAKWLAKSKGEKGDQAGPATYEFEVPEWIAVNNGWV